MSAIYGFWPRPTANNHYSHNGVIRIFEQRRIGHDNLEGFKVNPFTREEPYGFVDGKLEGLNYGPDSAKQRSYRLC